MKELYGQQMKENSNQQKFCQNFGSTGLKILDRQLQMYQQEAINKNINIDIYIQAPIHELVKKQKINQLKLQRAVGDLVRNSFQATEKIEKEGRKKGHILLIIGCHQEDILEIGVVDNGIEFPLHILENFGKRGNTTTGTGNGLADFVEFAKETNATICLSEFEEGASSFTKKVSVIFDKKGMNFLDSIRSGQVTSPFWSTIL